MKSSKITFVFMLIFSVFTVLIIMSCEENTKKDDSDNKVMINDTEELSLMKIPVKIEEESSRYEIDSELIGINVFKADLSQNMQVIILNKLFPGADITSAQASEVFDSYDIIYNKKDYSSIIVYEQNDDEDYVIHTIFISKGLFKEELLAKIFS